MMLYFQRKRNLQFNEFERKGASLNGSTVKASLSSIRHVKL